MMIGKVIKIIWSKNLKGENLHTLGLVFNEDEEYYDVAINEISQNTFEPIGPLKKIDKRLVVGEATKEDIENFKETNKLLL